MSAADYIKQMATEPPAEKRSIKINVKKDKDFTSDLDDIIQAREKEEVVDKGAEDAYKILQEFMAKEEEKPKEEEQKAPDIGVMLKLSETMYSDEWIEYYEKAMRSKKNNNVTRKMRAGRFRINESHDVEILADLDVSGIDANEMLDRRWD